MIKPTKPTVPPAPSRDNPGTVFSQTADTFAAFQSTFADYMKATADYVDDRSASAWAAAFLGDLPLLTGKALNMLRVNSEATEVEFRTPAQVAGDLGLTALAPSTRFAGAVMTAKSRMLGANYQNTTGGWLLVSVTCSNVGQAFYIGASSASICIATTNQSNGSILGLVPPGYYYICTGSTLSAWHEGQA